MSRQTAVESDRTEREDSKMILSLEADRRAPWAAPALIAVAILATFWSVCSHDFTNWDDQLNVTDNPHLNPPTTDGLAYFWGQAYTHEYIPLSYTAWWLLAQVARLDAPDAQGIWLNSYVYHTANLLLHLGVSLAVYQLLRLLTGRRWAACGGALLFALHPLQAEAVAWVTGLKDLLCALFSILALRQYVLAARMDGTAAGEGDQADRPAGLTSRRRHYVAGTAALIAAMLAKPSAVTVPVMALAIDWLILQRQWRKIALAITPWAIISVAFTAIGILAQPGGIIDTGPVWSRPLIAGDSLAFYLGKLFLPVGLSAVYHHSVHDVLAGRAVWTAWLAPVAMAGIAWAVRRRAPWFTAAAIIFLAAVLPVLGLLPFEYERISTVADRYVYLGMLGPSLAVAFALSWLRSLQSPLPARWAAVGCALALVPLAVLSAAQAGYWHDSKTLFTHVLKVDPASDIAYCNLATVALTSNRPAEAERLAARAIALDPERVNNRITRGLALVRLGRRDEAGNEFRKAYQVDPTNVVVLTNLAADFDRRGDSEQALALSRDAIRVDPEFADGHRALAIILSKRHQNHEAVREAGEAVRLDPGQAINHLVYGKLLELTGHRAQAAQQFSAVKALTPEAVETGGASPRDSHNGP